jgi:hypothetical protein
MAFRGIYPPAKLKPAPGGILSVADVMTHKSNDYDERWVRGFSFEFDSFPTVNILDEVGASAENLFDEAGTPRYLEYIPFFIEVESFESTFGLPGEDRFDRVKKQLEAVTQKAVEKELWDGPAAIAYGNDNIYLTKTGEATIPVAGAHSADKALFHLEQAISLSPVGANGVIHMTRDVASILGSRLIYVSKGDGERGKAITRLGTEVIIGSGYSGNGPIGATGATASATNRWMFATGPVEVHLGKVEVVNENLGQGIDASINDMRIKALRPAAVYFDPSIHYAMRVEVPANA